MNLGTLENPVELKTQDDVEKLYSDMKENIEKFIPCKKFTLAILCGTGELNCCSLMIKHLAEQAGWTVEVISNDEIFREPEVTHVLYNEDLAVSLGEMIDTIAGVHEESRLADAEYLPDPQQEQIYDSEPYKPCPPKQKRKNRKLRRLL